MNEQLQVALTEILNNTIEATGKATDFLVSEIPEVLQQLLMWKMCESLIWFSVCLVVSVVTVFGTLKVKSALDADPKQSKYGNELPPKGLIIFVLLLCGFIASSLTFDFTWLQILIAPKVYLLEYTASLTK